MPAASFAPLGLFQRLGDLLFDPWQLHALLSSLGAFLVSVGVVGIIPIRTRDLSPETVLVALLPALL